MPDLYFRGTITEFWNITYSEYNRLSTIFGRERFEFVFPDPKNSSLSDYKPHRYDIIQFVFWEKEHRDCLVSVKAAPALGSAMVEMEVAIYVDVVKTYGESNLEIWKSYINSLDEKGFLLKPTDFLASLPSKPVKPKPMMDRKFFHIYFERMRKSGYKYTFKQLAADLNVSVGHAKRLQGNFRKARGSED